MGAYSDRVIADGASHFWRLGETAGLTAVDVVAGVNGTISGGVTLGVPGGIADGTTAMTFNGTTGKIVTAGTVTIPVVVSAEAWIKTTQTGTQPALSFQPPTGNLILGINLSGGGPGRFSAYRDGPVLDGARVVADGAWHYVAAVLTATEARVYVDGVLDGTGVNVNMTGPQVTDASFGADSIYGLWWTGGIDEVALYPRVLTPAEIAAHYTLGITPQSSSRVTPWWQIAQIQGGTLVDSFNLWEPITPSNTVDLPRGPSGGILVGGAGDVAAVMQNNVMPVVFAGMPAGSWLPITARRINATGTTATGLVALYEQ